MAQAKTDRVLRAAHLYYVQDWTMAAIAKDLHTSRSSVSRLLAHARETGIVDIRINSPLERTGSLGRRIQSRFGVTAYIVPIGRNVSDVERLERVAMAAAKTLTGFISSHTVLGVAWGSTISTVSRHLTTKSVQSATIVQLNGAGNTLTTGVDYSSEILLRFGRAFGAKVQQFPVPALFDDPATREAMWRERSTRRVLDLQARMDVALFSVGSPVSDVPSRVYVGGYLDEADYQSLNNDGVIGDVATVFYRADGSWKDVRLNARATGPDLNRLRRVPRRLCVVAGSHKVASLRAALDANLVTDLVIDETLAEELTADV